MGVTLPAQILSLDTMAFAQRLATLRKERGITQPVLAARIGVHVSQLRRYEAGSSQPTLEVLRQMALALSVSADVLVFDEDERLADDNLRKQIEATSRLDPDERLVIKTLIDAILLKHEAKNWAAS
jgi:transcriptional regulator with XRE-family HTH domain